MAFHDEDIKFFDAEQQEGFGRNEGITYEQILNRSIDNVREAGNHEMRKGWFNEKTDKFGNVSRVYIEDTRKKYTASVQTVDDLSYCFYKGEIESKIESLKEQLKKIKQDLLNEQWTWFDSLEDTKKTKVINEYGMIYKIAFNTGLLWDEIYIEREIEHYRKIFRLITKFLAVEKNFFQEEEYEDD